MRPRITRFSVARWWAHWRAPRLHAAPAAAIDLLRSYELALRERRTAQGRPRPVRTPGARPCRRRFARCCPNVSLSAAYGQTEQDRSLNGIAQPTQHYPTQNNGVTLRQPIYRQYQFSQVDQAKSKVAGVDAQLDSDFQTLGVRLVTAYFDALFARDALNLIQAQKRCVRGPAACGQAGADGGVGNAHRHRRYPDEIRPAARRRDPRAAGDRRVDAAAGDLRRRAGRAADDPRSGALSGRRARSAGVAGLARSGARIQRRNCGR